MYRLIVLALTIVSTASISQAQRIEPLPAVPSAESEVIVDLGRLLFFDPRLSGDGSTACADCHDPNYGFGDGAELSRGYPGTKHWRNSQTLVNSVYLRNGLHWDGTVPSFVDQVPGAMGTPFAANIDVPMAEERLRQIPDYVTQFNSIWGEDPNIARIAEAISAYEQTLVSADSPYDRFALGDFDALSTEAKRGMVVFQGKGNCSACHSGGLYTDEAFHNTSVPRNPTFLEDPLVQISFRRSMRSFDVDPEVYMTLDRDPGYYAVTKNKDHLGAFRTPPLRYLKYTAPYMHNGMLYTLEEVVEFYDQGGTEDVFGTKSELIKPLRLTHQEKSDLVAFLESMSGTEIRENQPKLPEYAAIGIGTQLSATDRVQPAATEETLKIIPSQSGVSSEGSGLVISGSAGGLAIVEKASERVVIVEPGETLGSIAKREYGDVLRYLDILEYNKGVISDPNQLTPGIRLVLP